MQGRRDFLKSSAVIAAVALAGERRRSQTAGKFPPGLVYTKDAPGRWAGREGTHVPKAFAGREEPQGPEPHGMSEKHYVKHTVLTTEGKLIGERTFAPTDHDRRILVSAARRVQGDASGSRASANIHDLWLTEFTV